MSKTNEVNVAEEIKINTIKERRIKLHLVGDSPLILNGRSRSFEQEEIYKQSHTKGHTLPDEKNSKLHYNIWEKLITSITWEKPIKIHEHYEDYTEEEYHDLMENNKPCIKQKAFIASFTETFISFYKEATGRTGADFKRSVTITDPLIPINFTGYSYDQHLTPNSSVSHTNVLAQYTIFEGWSCDVTISFVESVIPTKTLIEIVNSTGMHIGIGTKRGESFGKYHVESAEIEAV